MDQRLFLSALIYQGKSGGWWRHLPAHFGHYKTVHSRFTAWSKRKVFETLFHLVSQEDDLTVLRFLDSAFVKASICSTTGRCSDPQRLIGRTKGGFTSRVTILCDAKMRVHVCQVDPGQYSDHRIAESIALPGKGKIITADKGYSSQKFRQRIEALLHKHCIAKKDNDSNVVTFNKAYYRKRHKVENDFAKMRRWTRLELRRERLHYNFRAFLMLWSIVTWLPF